MEINMSMDTLTPRRASYLRDLTATLDTITAWEVVDDDDGEPREVALLGSVFTLTPSGKVYTPFACSNVAGDCPVCKGKGEHVNRKADVRAHARYKRERTKLTQAAIKAHGFFADWPTPIRDRAMRLDAKMAATAPTIGCTACSNMGSLSAARDADWNDMLELACARRGWSVDYHDDDIFVARAPREAWAWEPMGELAPDMRYAWGRLTGPGGDRIVLSTSGYSPRRAAYVVHLHGSTTAGPVVYLPLPVGPGTLAHAVDALTRARRWGPARRVLVGRLTGPT